MSTFETELARDAARVAADYLEANGRSVEKIVVAVSTAEGGGAIVGMRGLEGDDVELLEHLAHFMTVLAGSQGKHLRILGL